MSDLVKQITIGEDTYKIGADAENISYGNNSNVYAEIESLKNGSNGGGNNKVSTTDLVVENSLTVNGSVVEGKGHNSNVIGKAWISLGIDPITINSTSNGTSYISCSQELVNIYKDLSYKYKTILNNSKSYFMERLNCAAQGIGTYFKCDFYMQQYDRKVDNVLCVMSDYEVALYHNEDGLLTFDPYGGSNVFIYFKEAASTDEEKNIHIAGKYSDVNSSNINTYAHVVGGGISDSNRKNIYTLDWNGNATFMGDIKLNQSTIIDDPIWNPLTSNTIINAQSSSTGGVSWSNNTNFITNSVTSYSCQFIGISSSSLPDGYYYGTTFNGIEIIVKIDTGDTMSRITMEYYANNNSNIDKNTNITITHKLKDSNMIITHLTPKQPETIYQPISLLDTIKNLQERITALEAK